MRLAGRKEVVGQPFMYRTTKEFLAHFGLDNIDDLPPLEEFEEMLGVELGAVGQREPEAGAELGDRCSRLSPKAGRK